MTRAGMDCFLSFTGVGATWKLAGGWWREMRNFTGDVKEN